MSARPSSRPRRGELAPRVRAARAVLAPLAAALLGACRSSDVAAPLGERTTLVFEGVRSLPEEELRAAIAADRYGPRPERATRSQVDDAAYAVEEHYRSQGFAEAEVDFAFEEGAPSEAPEGEAEEAAAGPVTARLVVAEGPRLVLVDVSFEGNEGFDDELLELFFLPDEEPRPFVRAQVRSARSGIEEYYYQRGWLRARVAEAEERIDPARGTVRLGCTVDEGTRFVLEDATLAFAEGAEPLPAVGLALERATRERRGRPYTPQLAYVLRAALLEAAGEAGHPEAEVEVASELDEDTGLVRLAYAVTPGPFVRVSEVRIEGADPGHEDVVRDRLELEAGGRWDEGKVRRSFANLYRSGFFRMVEIELAPRDEGVEPAPSEERVLVVRVEELPSVELFVQPGYGSYEGPRLTVGFDERNLFRTGTGLRGEATLGALARGAELAWNHPWIADGRYETRVAISADHREEPSFTENEAGTELSLTRRWSETTRSTLSYGFRRTTLEDDPLPEEALQDVDIASFTLSTTHDDRDDPFTPRGGGRERASVEWASTGFGSEVDFLGLNAEVAHFYDLSQHTVLGFRLLAGVKQPIADTETLPIQESFFNGGENTVRSFAEDELGPRDDDGEPLGGQAFNVFNLELRQHLFGHLQAGLFADAGNVSLLAEDYLSFEDVSTALGIGLRYLLPIGPVRLDLGWNPDPEDDEDDLVLHLSIGMPF